MVADATVRAVQRRTTASMPPTTARRTTVQGSASPVVTPRVESERLEPQAAGAMLPKVPRVLDGHVGAPGGGSDTSAFRRVAPPVSAPPETSKLRPHRSTAAASEATGSRQRAARGQLLDGGGPATQAVDGARGARCRRWGADGHARTVRQPGLDDRPGVRVPAERSGHPSPRPVVPPPRSGCSAACFSETPWSDAAHRRLGACGGPAPSTLRPCRPLRPPRSRKGATFRPGSVGRFRRRLGVAALSITFSSASDGRGTWIDVDHLPFVYPSAHAAVSSRRWACYGTGCP